MGSHASGEAADIHPLRLARNALWLTGGEVLSRLIAFAVAVYLARVLGAEGYGLLGVAFAVVSYLLILVDGGFDPYGTREVARHPEALPQIVRRVAGTRLALALLTYALLIGLVFALPAKAVGGRELALIYGARFFAYALRLEWALRGREAMAAIAAGLLVQHVIYAGGIFSLVRDTRAVVTLVALIQVVAEFSLVGWYLLWVRRRYGHLWAGADPARGRGMVREAWPVGLAKGLRLAYYEGDLLLIGWLSTTAEAGYFLASHKIILSLAVLLVLYQHNAFPLLSRLMYVDAGRASRFQDNVSRYALLLSVPLAVGGAMISRPLIQAVFGPGFERTSPIFVTMVFTLPLVAVTAGLHNQLLAGGHSAWFSTSVGVGAVVHLALGVWWVSAWSALGAARASLAGEVTTLCVAAYCVRKGEKTFPLGWRVVPVALSGCLMAFLMYYFRDLPVLGRSLLGCLAYSLGVLVMGGISAQEWRFLEDLVTRKVR